MVILERINLGSSSTQSLQHVICEVIKIGTCRVRTVHAQMINLIVSTFRMVLFCNNFIVSLCLAPGDFTCHEKSFWKSISTLYLTWLSFSNWLNIPEKLTYFTSEELSGSCCRKGWRYCLTLYWARLSFGNFLILLFCLTPGDLTCRVRAFTKLYDQ